MRGEVTARYQLFEPDSHLAMPTGCGRRPPPTARTPNEVGRTPPEGSRQVRNGIAICVEVPQQRSITLERQERSFRSEIFGVLFSKASLTADEPCRVVDGASTQNEELRDGGRHPGSVQAGGTQSP
jgi:hypothetical protein